MDGDNLDFELRRGSLSEQVADEIEGLLMRDQLKDGDRLPSERILAERLHVSRTVIREATRVLRARELVEIKPGSGTYLCRPTANSSLRPISQFLRHSPNAGTLENLSEVRFALEVEIAGWAAIRRTRENIDRLEVEIANMERFKNDGVKFAHHDLAFHSELARATQNEVFELLVKPISDLLLDLRLTDYDLDAKSSILGGLRHHRAILKAVQERNRPDARAAMKAHLKQAARVLSKSGSLTRSGSRPDHGDDR